jgi:pimeloyl-ACP methyl ester carboxylesterase
MMISLADTKKYRVYALDFWGFGDSAKGSQAQTATFQIESYVEMVNQFMDSLGIQSAPIFGHSMGGTVALQISLAHPERVEKVALVGSPIIGSSMHPFLQLAGYGSIAKLVWRYPIMLNSIMRILLAKDSKKVRTMIFRDVQRTTIESFFRSIGDLRDTDLRNQLPTLDIPVLGIYGAKDKIVSPMNGDLLRIGVKSVQVQVMEFSRHFPMTDEPERFLKTVNGFLNNHLNGQVVLE